MIEKWRPITDFEGLYEVSNLGRVKSLRRYVLAGKAGWRWTREKIIRGSLDRYLFVNLRRANAAPVHRYIHRMVATAFLHNPDNKRTVNHIDGDKLNNRADNLEWATYAENARHAVRTGLQKYCRGSAWHAAKLTDDDVREIRASYIGGKRGNCVALAKKYGVVRETIAAIGNWRKWTEVPCKMDCTCGKCTREAA